MTTLSLHKYDKICVKSRTKQKLPEPVKYNQEEYTQLRMYFKCESQYYTKHMKVNFWYSKDIEQWRWILTCDEDISIHESGSRKNLRLALNDVATTMEYLLDEEVIE